MRDRLLFPSSRSEIAGLPPPLLELPSAVEAGLNFFETSFPHTGRLRGSTGRTSSTTEPLTTTWRPTPDLLKTSPALPLHRGHEPGRATVKEQADKTEVLEPTFFNLAWRLGSVDSINCCDHMKLSTSGQLNHYH
ncbi:unnamed protein product [Lota lota]